MDYAHSDEIKPAVSTAVRTAMTWVGLIGLGVLFVESVVKNAPASASVPHAASHGVSEQSERGAACGTDADAGARAVPHGVSESGDCGAAFGRSDMLY